MNKTRVRALIILSIVVIVLGAALFWVLSNSYVSAAVTNATNANLTYYFTDQKSGKTTSATSNQSSYKKRLPKGSYTVRVTQDLTSYVTAVKTSGLLRTTSTQGELVAEKSRTFVGNNPSPCMFYNSVLYSFSCGVSLDKVNRHVPATATSPTYVTQPFENDYQDFDSSVTTANGNLYVLVNESSDSGGYVLAGMDGSGKLTDIAKLPDLDIHTTYRIAPYKSGFVVFNEGLDKLLYYSSPKAKPEKISIDKPKDKKLQGASLTTLGDTLVLMYSTASSAKVSDSGKNAAKNVKDEVVVFRNGTAQRYTPKTHATAAFLCGTNRLCTIEGTSLVVYGLSDKKLAEQYRFTDVQAARAVGKNVYVVQTDQVLVLNPDNAKGYVAYSLGSYKYCGQGQTGDSLLLCAISSKNQKVALLIDPTKPIGSPIDKQVAELAKQAEVTSVSTYKNFIYIVPNYGRVTLRPETGTYGYDPAVVKVVNQKISSKIKAVGIDTSVYTVSGLH